MNEISKIFLSKFKLGCRLQNQQRIGQISLAQHGRIFTQRSTVFFDSPGIFTFMCYVLGSAPSTFMQRVQNEYYVNICCYSKDA